MKLIWCTLAIYFRFSFRKEYVICVEHSIFLDFLNTHTHIHRESIQKPNLIFYSNSWFFFLFFFLILLLYQISIAVFNLWHYSGMVRHTISSFSYIFWIQHYRPLRIIYFTPLLLFQILFFFLCSAFSLSLSSTSFSSVNRDTSLNILT